MKPVEQDSEKATRPEAMKVQCPKCFKMPGSVCMTTLGRPYRRLHIHRFDKATVAKARKAKKQK